MKELKSCPFEEPAGAYEIVPGEKKKTRFEKITESPTSLAYFLMDVRCNVGHYKYDEYPPASEPEEMERWLNEECEWKK